MIHKGRLPPPVASRAPDDGHGMCALIIAIHSHCFLVCPAVVSRVRAFGYEVSRVNTGESEALAQDSCFSTERWELEQSPPSALRPRVGWPKMSRPRIFTHLLVQCSRILSTYVLDFTQNVAGIWQRRDTIPIVGSPALSVLSTTTEKEETGSGSPSGSMGAGEGGTPGEKGFRAASQHCSPRIFSNG